MDIIQITDLHITRDVNQKKHDCEPYLRLSDILRRIKTNHKDIEYLVITGDLSNDYSP